ncbi:MAG: glycosyltransferase family 2 protein [Gemmatimonadales bacterium]
MPQPVISVIVVSDYNSAGQRTWHDERTCLEAVAAQDLKEPFEVVISEDDKYRNTFPDELLSIVTGSRVIFSTSSSSYGLKNSGARAAESPIVVLLDADCKPDVDWLRIIVETMRAHPEVAAVSGRTFYEGKGLDTRVLALLSRSYLDPGIRGETSYVSNNAGAFRREVFLAHPLPEDLGAFSSRLQSEAMKRDGCILWFEPAMRVVHEFEGWPMEADIRRNIGYGTIATRIAEPMMPHASLIRMGVVATPVVAAGKLINSWRDCFRCASAYGVRWFELPVALGAAVVVNLMEIPGMVAAYRHGSIQDTAYR